MHTHVHMHMFMHMCMVHVHVHALGWYRPSVGVSRDVGC